MLYNCKMKVLPEVLKKGKTKKYTFMHYNIVEKIDSVTTCTQTHTRPKHNIEDAFKNHVSYRGLVCTPQHLDFVVPSISSQ